jgi:hypothetical protein
MYLWFDKEKVASVKRGLKLKKRVDFEELTAEEELVICTEIRRFYKTYEIEHREPPTYHQMIYYMLKYQHVAMSEETAERILGSNLDKYEVLKELPEIPRGPIVLEDIYEEDYDPLAEASQTNDYDESYYAIRDLVLKRDSMMCSICGNISRLCAHHIDNNKSHNWMENLITLCSDCHMSLPIHRFKSNFIDLELVKKLSITAIIRTYEIMNKAG